VKYIVAIIGALIVFIGAGLVSGAVLFFVSPESWQKYYIDLGFISVNLPNLIAFIIASLAATNSFWASIRLNAKKHKKS